MLGASTVLISLLSGKSWKMSKRSSQSLPSLSTVFNEYKLNSGFATQINMKKLVEKYKLSTKTNTN